MWGLLIAQRFVLTMVGTVPKMFVMVRGAAGPENSGRVRARERCYQITDQIIGGRTKPSMTAAWGGSLHWFGTTKGSIETRHTIAGRRPRTQGVEETRERLQSRDHCCSESITEAQGCLELENYGGEILTIFFGNGILYSKYVGEAGGKKLGLWPQTTGNEEG